MKYQKVINDLRHSINNKHNNELFKKSIAILKNDFGFNISTKFLRGLYDGLDFRKRTKRINYLMRTNGLKTIKEIRLYTIWDLNIYKTKIIEYTYNKKYKLRDEEKAFVKNIRDEKIGREFRNHKKEVLFMVVI